MVNAADNKQRDPSMTTIKVDIDRETNTISVANDGKGIPVQIHSEHNCYVPELIFGAPPRAPLWERGSCGGRRLGWRAQARFRGIVRGPAPPPLWPSPSGRPVRHGRPAGPGRPKTIAQQFPPSSWAQLPAAAPERPPRPPARHTAFSSLKRRRIRGLISVAEYQCKCSQFTP